MTNKFLRLHLEEFGRIFHNRKSSGISDRIEVISGICVRNKNVDPVSDYY